MLQIIKIVVISAVVSILAFNILASQNRSNKSDPLKVVSTQQPEREITTIRCGYATWPPYLMKDPNTAELSGISYDLITELSQLMNIEFEWVEEVSFGNFIEGFETNRYDMLCISVWPEPERIKRSVVTIPLYYSTLSAYVRADDFRFDGDLQKINSPDVKTIHIEGDATQEVGERFFPKADRYGLPQMSDHAQYFTTLTSGKGDIIFIDDGLFIDFEANNPGLIRKVANVPPVQLFPEMLSLNPSIGHMKPAFDAAIHTMIANGEMARILGNYDVSTYAQKINLNIME